MRSAIYYPRTEVQDRQLMQSSLLLWDQLYTIVPEKPYTPNYGKRLDMAEAWELIGETLVPSSSQKRRAHDAIEATLEGGLPPNLYNVGEIDQPIDRYEIWPQKFAIETWDLMRRHRLTDLPLPNGDYPFTQEGGLLVMAKLADACAGTQFARVTDRLMAYGLIGSGDRHPSTEAEVIPITLDLIDASSVPLQSLVALRKRERSERRGEDYSKLRHNYADMVQNQVAMLGAACDQFERDELTRQFRARMKTDLNHLRNELGGNKIDLVLKPVVVATLLAGGSFLSGALPGHAALAIGAAAAAGSGAMDIAKKITDFFAAGLKFNRDQRATMVKYPMAYMYALSSIH